MPVHASNSIVSVRFVVEVDDYPDLSYLGEYSDTAEEHHIDRAARGHWNVRNREYRYFNLGTGEPEYIERDYERYEAYNAGVWSMTRVMAEATVNLGGILQTLTSGGCGGIESDCDKDYLAAARRDELYELRGVLVACGFSDEYITAAFQEVEDEG